MEKYKDKSLSPRERAEDLLSRMSMEEKIDQLGCAFFKGKNTADPEGLISAGLGTIGVSVVIESAESMRKLICKIQKQVMEKSRFHIPALIHIEAVAGGLFPQATAFPSAIAQASGWNPGLMEEMAKCIGKELQEVGFRHALSPVFDICRDPRWGRLMETYGEDETLASAMSAAFVKGIQRGGDENMVAATGKHFVGHGISECGLNQAQNNVTERELREVHCKPFQAAMTEAGLISVMNSYGSINREPVVSSKKMLTDLLRGELGFQGLVVSDYFAINRLVEPYRIASDYTEAGIMSLEAGIDVEYPAPLGYSHDLEKAVADGRLDGGLIDRSAFRLLELKFRMGLFEKPYQEQEVKKAVFENAKSETVCREMARGAITLLKNERALLPLDKSHKKIAVVGPHGDRIRSLFGAYSYAGMLDLIEDDLNNNTEPRQNTGQKMASVYQRFPGELRETPIYVEEMIRKVYPKAKTLFEAIRDLAPDCQVSFAQGISYTGNCLAGYEEALNCAAQAEVVILTLGGQSGWGAVATNGEGIDNSNIDLPGMQEKFARDIYRLNKKTIVIHMDGRPLMNGFVTSHFDAILEAWQLGEYGFEELAKVLFGESEPGGRLPVTAARSGDVLPTYYGQPRGTGYHNAGKEGTYASLYGYINTDNRPVYDFGHGLSYTDFSFSNLTVSADEIEAEGELVLTVDIKNTGNRYGEVVPQLYIEDVQASVIRPYMMLAGFAKTGLEAQEEKRIQFTVKMSQLAFLDEDMKWKVEKGEMNALVGVSSGKILLRRGFKILNDAYIEGRTRGFYAIGEAIPLT